ncbi:hypothetical protein MNR01_09230 [Lysobacter sp. S4-A87]|uniref:hypothetical protein n=1 Tax=Lysobacter sp. S4-A87 TaxID=2925843 RepID=UPI001F53312E|nr:hypothetical protein [Lysobacter sp. S4-A87]UNK47974.1 hypothetical protein MNR01_09230 [Lysobacter sp. S4-A87]
MNTPDDRKPLGNHRLPAESQRLEREWQAQERAMEQERRGVPLDPADPRIGEYRLIARALRAPAMEPVPYDLAAQIVRRVEAAQTLGERVEGWLLRILIAVLAMAAVGAVAIYGAGWASAFAALWPQPSPQAAGWGGLLLVCLGLSLAWQWGGRMLHHDQGHPA